MAMNTTTPNPPRSLLYIGPILGLAAVTLLMFMPMVVVRESTGTADLATAAAGVSSATAALSAIFRASARTILRSSLLLAVRATTRTFSRRIARAALRSMLGTLLPVFRTAKLGGVQRRQSGLTAIALGFVTLVFSFYGVVMLMGHDSSEALLHGRTIGTIALLAGLPLLVHTGLMLLASKITGVSVSFHTTIDGLLLQAYFTGAGSFMPLCSDAELDENASPRKRASCAAIVLLGLLGVGFLIDAIAALSGAYWLSTLSGIFLLYGFVFAFPLQPLDGKDLWDFSKAGWAVVFLLVLYAFVTRMPEALYDIL